MLRLTRWHHHHVPRPCCYQTLTSAHFVGRLIWTHIVFTFRARKLLSQSITSVKHRQPSPITFETNIQTNLIATFSTISTFEASDIGLQSLGIGLSRSGSVADIYPKIVALYYRRCRGHVGLEGLPNSSVNLSDNDFDNDSDDDNDIDNEW